MRIISKFKDYYDFVAGRDTDPRKVYIRELKMMPAWSKDAPILANQRSCEFCKREVGYFMGEVWFCDNRYPYLQDLSNGTIYYDYQEIPEDAQIDLEMLIIRGHHFGLADHFGVKLKKDTIFRWRKRGYLVSRFFHQFHHFQKEKETKLNTKWNAPIIFSWLRDSYAEEVVVNGPLNWVKFTQIKSPTVTFQEIYNWIPYIEPEMPNDPTDMIRFVNKGFDIKTSFRGK